MKRFTFDIKLFVTAHIKAPDEETARRWIHEALDGRSMGLAFADGGEEVDLGEAGIDGELDLVDEEESYTPSNLHGASKHTSEAQTDTYEENDNE